MMYLVEFLPSFFLPSSPPLSLSLSKLVLVGFFQIFDFFVSSLSLNLGSFVISCPQKYLEHIFRWIYNFYLYQILCVCKDDSWLVATARSKCWTGIWGMKMLSLRLYYVRGTRLWGRLGQRLRRILVRLRNGNRKGRRLSFPECPLCASSTYCVPDSLHCKLRAPINLLAQSSSYQPIVQMRPQHTGEAETVESPLAIVS